MADERRLHGVTLTAATLDAVRHSALRAEAESALARQEPVRLLVGTSADGARVETIVTGSSRAAQSTGGHVIRGVWTSGRLATDAGDHLLDADGACFCRDCEAAGGNCVDDDE